MLNCRLKDWQPGHGTLSLMDKTLKLCNPEVKNCVIQKNNPEKLNTLIAG